MLLMALQSTHMRQLPSFFGTKMTGTEQGLSVGVSTSGGGGGVPGPPSQFVAARPSPDGLAQDGTQGESAARVISHHGGVLVVGVTSVRERERVSLFVSSFSRATLPHEGPGPPFYRCKERVQVYNGGCSYALTCLAERCLSPVYMPTWLSERC
jgi:hypothetical protein